MSVNSRLKVTKTIGQRKAFYRQRIPESSHVRKETVDKDILVTSRFGDIKIIQSIRITSRPTSRIRKWNQLRQFRGTSMNKDKEVEPVETVQMNTYQSNTYRKDLTWLHFEDEPRI